MFMDTLRDGYAQRLQEYRLIGALEWGKTRKKDLLQTLDSGAIADARSMNAACCLMY
jgi:hypothetical protein